jgi:hypothetical protein
MRCSLFLGFPCQSVLLLANDDDDDDDDGIVTDLEIPPRLRLAKGSLVNSLCVAVENDVKPLSCSHFSNASM